MFQRIFKFNAARTLAACGVGAAALLGTPAHAADAAQSSWCAAAKPVKFAEMGWDSAKFMTEVVRYVLEKGYGCRTELMTATNAIALQAITTGDLNVMVEYWAGRTPAYEKAVQDGRVTIVGSLVNGGSVEGYYVPEYVIKGDPARGIKPLAPDLKSIADLPRYKSVFADPEDPSRGRLYNCPIGWQCESDTEQKMKAYKIGAAYTDFHPGSGPALDAAVESAFTRGKPILFYYWEPSTILGRFRAVKLDEPAYNANCWKTINGSKDPNPCGSASPPTSLRVVVSNSVADSDPVLMSLFEKVQFSIGALNATIARMATDKVQPRQAALDFLKANPSLVAQWVPAAAAQKVAASLK
ncbi:glycine betaine ABC transporter substrate-binding protein [Burkholderia thailandensis]|uniref:glycine betaine ABC transporter substrate-binding protein n=1 Tax=Burkholderia thailandensis TaxID=57975 RepID=UPI002D79E2DB|nr:glycine betaine ABC transporter substrate-binding protein [Burkholderia thailandensis]WRS69960.1 glycine betaine ABC transporter substrate-binding protein [Burkholderia thailandensis]